jgi:acyl transferase domain-containing protein/acyl carrier protein
LQDKLEAALTQTVSQQLKIEVEHLDRETELSEFGFDSIGLMALGNQLNERYGLELAPTVFFEYPTLAKLAEYLAREHSQVLAAQFTLRSSSTGKNVPSEQPAQIGLTAQTSPTVTSRRARQRFVAANTSTVKAPSGAMDIAIIGLSGRYPKANTLEEYWRNLTQGVDCITEIPPERWDHGRYFDPEKGKAGKSYSKWGGFIDGVDQFDPLFFNISPREAVAMDPQERLFLQAVWTLLEEGGHTRDSLRQQYQGRIGVYVGAMFQHDQPEGAETQSPSISSFATIANRTSSFFNLEGPSMAVDTMSSSAAMAIHLACKDLVHGECGLAIAGGVNLSLHPNKYIRLSEIGVLSSNTDSRSFGAGDGYLPSEGVGAVLLKPLAQAEADGDRILAVIKGSATVHAGNSNSYMVPNLGMQSKVMEESLRRAGVAARTISCVEAAAVGMALGDAIEVAALSKVFGSDVHERPWCALGSVKSNLGHPEAASCMAQLTKVVRQLTHRQLVPSIKATRMNPNIRLEGTPFAIQHDLAQWVQPSIRVDGQDRDVPRRALINAFGAGGTYVSLVVEEYAPAVPRAVEPARGVDRPQIVVLSARTADRLQAVAAQLLTHIEQHTELSLRDIAYSLQLSRDAMEHRLALVANTLEDLRGKLAQYLGGDARVEELYRGEVKRNKDALALFAADEDAHELVDRWLAKGKLTKLAEAWAKGLMLDWRKLYGEATPRRISLPTYPFARERCCVEKHSTELQTVLPAVPLTPNVKPGRLALVAPEGKVFGLRKGEALQMEI